jgi:mannose-6-phosphate isomerase-like protein (cupin superfamily)
MGTSVLSTCLHIIPIKYNHSHNNKSNRILESDGLPDVISSFSNQGNPMKIITASRSPRYRRDGITSYLLVSEITTGARRLTTSLVEMQPGGRQHVHHKTEQCYFILSGRGEMTVGNEKKTVSAGEVIFIPSKAPHGLKNPGKGVLKYYSAGSPPFGKEKESELWPLRPAFHK